MDDEQLTLTGVSGVRSGGVRSQDISIISISPHYHTILLLYVISSSETSLVVIIGN